MTSYTVCEKCGKRGFRSKRAARLANRSNGHKLKVYQCGHYWHVAKEVSQKDWVAEQ